MGLLRRRPERPSRYVPARTDPPLLRYVEVDGREYECYVVPAPNGSWEVAYGREMDGGGSVAIVLEDGSPRTTSPVPRPIEAVVANDGTHVIVDGGNASSIGGELVARSATGESLFTHRFEANVETVDLTADGRLAVASTRGAGAKAVLFDVNDGTVRTEFSTESTDGKLLGFGSNDEHVYFSRGKTVPYFAIDVDGEIAWRSERFRDAESFSSRLRRWIAH